MTIERRKFLAATAATGAALSLTDAATAAAVQGANERLRVGVMGTGGRGTGLATSFQRQPNVDVTFVCDVDRAGSRIGPATIDIADEGHIDVIDIQFVTGD